MSHPADGPPLEEPPRPALEVKSPLIYERIVQFRSKYLAGQEIPSVGALISEIEERERVLGEAAEQATQAVVEELERAAAAINVRTAPLVPTCGLVVAGAGVLEKFITPTPLLGLLAGVAIGLAMIGLYFSVVGMFTHAGRRKVGLIPTQEDVAFVRARLIKKEANAQIGSVLIPLGLIVLVVLILNSFYLDINITL
jgi:hypothetical protein